MTESATLVYHDADGNEVPEGSEAAVVQYRSDDPNRPKPADKATTAPPEDKAVKGSSNK